MDDARLPLAVLISGRGSNLKALIDARQDAYRIVLVASNIEDAGGLAHARGAGIATYAHGHRGLEREAFDRLIDAELTGHGVAAIALAGYLRMLSPWFVRRWAGRIVNIHPSLLPRHKGLRTHEAALAAGDARHGCTVHLVTEALDDGPVLAQAEVAVLPSDTPDTLGARVLDEEHRLYPQTLARWAESL
jgi:formyltetrahydrofolate-dependent phosphoribosylglycinamide formyltransferase